MRYTASSHSAKHTGDFVFSQLIPYIGNKRKLLGLIQIAVTATGLRPERSKFLDSFSGSRGVDRFAKKMGFQVTANDWEPYAEALGRCFIENNSAPLFTDDQTYEETISYLNNLSPVDGWITSHLCPSDDEQYDIAVDRMFYMRKNGMRIDAVREQLQAWEEAAMLKPMQKPSLLGPLH